QQAQSNNQPISDLVTTELVINSQSFNIPSSGSSTSKTGLIVGVTVGLAAGLGIILAVIYASYKFNKRFKHRRLINDTEMNNRSNGPENDSLTSPETSELQSTPISNPSLPTETTRVPSAVSVTTLNVTETIKSMTPVQHI
ncbi:unnamed protein product, partial [Adineta steineri]